MRRQQESPGQTQSRHSASITSFSQLSNVTLSFSFTVEQDIPVQGLKPAQVKVYDYYETGKHGAEGVSGSDCGELDSWRCLRAMETHSCPWHLSHCTPGRGTSDSPALSLPFCFSDEFAIQEYSAPCTTGRVHRNRWPIANYFEWKSFANLRFPQPTYSL